MGLRTLLPPPVWRRRHLQALTICRPCCASPVPHRPVLSRAPALASLSSPPCLTLACRVPGPLRLIWAGPELPPGPPRRSLHPPAPPDTLTLSFSALATITPPVNRTWPSRAPGPYPGASRPRTRPTSCLPNAAKTSPPRPVLSRAPPRTSSSCPPT